MSIKSCAPLDREKRPDAAVPAGITLTTDEAKYCRFCRVFLHLPVRPAGSANANEGCGTVEVALSVRLGGECPWMRCVARSTEAFDAGYSHCDRLRHRCAGFCVRSSPQERHLVCAPANWPQSLEASRENVGYRPQFMAWRTRRLRRCGPLPPHGRCEPIDTTTKPAYEIRQLV
jgi:hypothetical protein